MSLASVPALAAAQAAPVLTSPAIPNSQDQLIQVCLALAVVLGLIYALAWFIKRKQVIGSSSQIPMKTLAVLPMGVKEKIILIEVGGKQILLGMTSSNINTLATFDEPITNTDEPKSRSFSQKLKEILAQQKSDAQTSHQDTIKTAAEKVNFDEP